MSAYQSNQELTQKSEEKRDMEKTMNHALDLLQQRNGVVRAERVDAGLHPGALGRRLVGGQGCVGVPGRVVVGCVWVGGCVSVGPDDTRGSTQERVKRAMRSRK